jgi:hypothetical protein
MLMTGILDYGLHSDYSMNMPALKKSKQVPEKVLTVQAAIVTMKNAIQPIEALQSVDQIDNC